MGSRNGESEWHERTLRCVALTHGWGRFEVLDAERGVLDAVPWIPPAVRWLLVQRGALPNEERVMGGITADVHGSKGWTKAGIWVDPIPVADTAMRARLRDDLFELATLVAERECGQSLWVETAEPPVRLVTRRQEPLDGSGPGMLIATFEYASGERLSRPCHGDGDLDELRRRLRLPDAALANAAGMK